LLLLVSLDSNNFGCRLSFVVLVADSKLGYDPSYSEGWCWLKELDPQSQRVFWHLLEGKGLELLTIIATAGIYIKIKLHVMRNRTTATESTVLISSHGMSAFIGTSGKIWTCLLATGRQVADEIDRKLILVPALFIFFRIWGTIRFFLSTYLSDDPAGDLQFWFSLLQVRRC
jgi:hypothetical protein